MNSRNHRLMFRSLTIAGLACLTLIPTHAEDPLLVKINRMPSQNLTRGQVLEYDLGEYFQIHNSPGPVLRMSFRAPELDEPRLLFTGRETDPFSGEYLKGEDGRYITTDTNPVNVTTYKTQSGEPYDHLFGAYPEDFVWHEHTLTYQLYPADAPENVANLLAYVQRGDYEETFIHRTENQNDGAFRLIQGGGVRRYRGDLPAVVEPVPQLSPVILEAERSNVPGTLAMARTNLPDSATSQFYINISDNSSFFDDFYTVIGELLDGDLDKVSDLTLAPRFDLSNWAGMLGATPLFSPLTYDPQSWITFYGFAFDPGTTDGISYAWAFTEPEEEESENGEGDEEEEEEEEEPEDPWHRDSFEIDIDDGRLTILRKDTGFAEIEVTASALGMEKSYRLFLTSYNPDLQQYFGQLEIHTGDYYVSPWFGGFVDLDTRFVRHDLLQTVHISTVAAQSVARVLYSEQHGWLWLRTDRFPWIYQASQDRWLHMPGAVPGDQAYFYDLNAGIWIDFLGNSVPSATAAE